MDNKQLNQALQLNRFMQMSVQSANLPDEKAMEVADLYPEWKEKQKYTVDTILKYGVNADGETQLYKVVQEHTSQADWTPDANPSLYKKVGFDEETGVPIWTQSQGAHDAYNTGDIVMHNGVKYKSTVDGNTWEPGVYGWEIVTE